MASRAGHFFDIYLQRMIMSLTIEPELEGNLSRAWARAFLGISACTGREATGLSVYINAPNGELHEEETIRDLLEKSLQQMPRHTLIDTVASTIFPWSMWNPDLPRTKLIERYRKIYGTIQKQDRRNHHGTYFGRFIEYHNQLEHVLQTREGGNHRRSAYQLSTFDPSKDHGDWRQRGFPCLHQVSLVPDTKSDTLGVVAYYPTQTLFEKAYGNYLGLWHLGQFIASEWGLTMTSLTVFAAVAKQTAGKTQANQLAKALVPELETLV